MCLNIVENLNVIPTKTLPSRAPSLHENKSESGAKDGRILVGISIIEDRIVN